MGSAAVRHRSSSRSTAALNRAGLRRLTPRSKPAVAIATFQPLPTSPRVLATGTRTSSKKISAKPVSPSSWAIGRTVTPGRSSGIRMNVRPRWRWDSGSVRKMPKHQSAPHRPAGPDLLPVQHPLVAVQAGGAADRRQVAAGVGLAPGLGPDDLAGRHRRQEPLLLGLGAHLHDRGAEQEDAVLVDPARCARPGSTPPRRSAIRGSRSRGRRTRRATTPPTSGRRPAWPPSDGAARTLRRCRSSAAACPGRWPPATRGPRHGRPARLVYGEIHGVADSSGI